MPRSKDPSGYPPMFPEYIDRAFDSTAEAPYIFPCSTKKGAHALVAHINAYRRAIKHSYDSGHEHLYDFSRKCNAITISLRGTSLYAYNLYSSGDYKRLQASLGMADQVQEPMPIPPVPAPIEPSLFEQAKKEAFGSKQRALEETNFYTKTLQQSGVVVPSVEALLTQQPSSPNTPTSILEPTPAPAPRRAIPRPPGADIEPDLAPVVVDSDKRADLSSENSPPNPNPEPKP